MTLNFIPNTKACLLPLVCFLIPWGCGTLKDSPKYRLSDSVYSYREKGGKYQKGWVYVKNDTISMFSYKDQGRILKSRLNNDQFFLKRSFDVDVMTVGFKYRSAID